MPNRKKLWLIPLILAGLWVGLVFVPVLIAVAFPPTDFSQIVGALERHGTPPPLAADYVNRWVGGVGSLQRAVPVGYFVRVEATFQLRASRNLKKTQMSYIAWFENIHKPILLLIERYDASGGERTYNIAEGEPASIVRAVGLPPLAFLFFLYMTLKKKAQTSGPSS
jgi:hypothetical protein